MATTYTKSGTDDQGYLYYAVKVDGDFQGTVHRTLDGSKWVMYYGKEHAFTGKTRTEAYEAYQAHREQVWASQPQPEKKPLQVALEIAQEFVANYKASELEEFSITESTSKTYQREYEKALEVCASGSDWQHYYNAENLEPQLFNASGWYDGQIDWEKGASRWSDIDISAYKKAPTTEQYIESTDSYTFASHIRIDKEYQNEYAININFPDCKSTENIVEYASGERDTEWLKDNVNIDKPSTGGWRQTIAYCCILPTPKPRMFRCTRNSAYRGHDVLGSTDISARQGHYIEAISEKEALVKMSTMFPYDNLGFTATPWN